MLDRITLIEGDITKQEVDAIVNAANETLLGGDGVDGAIHRAAGRGLLEECRKLNGFATGEAKITGGYSLPCRWVIHTVGPVWKLGPVSEIGRRGGDELLARCYGNSLTLTEQYKIRTIAFPAMSTGAFCFPIDRAAKIAVSEVKQFLANDSSIDQVILVCLGQSAYQRYLKAAEDIA